MLILSSLNDGEADLNNEFLDDETVNDEDDLLKEFLIIDLLDEEDEEK